MATRDSARAYAECGMVGVPLAALAGVAARAVVEVDGEAGTDHRAVTVPSFGGLFAPSQVGEFPVDASAGRWIGTVP